ncbi:MAG TPA: hypothetical protein VHK27_03225 [Gammaproteobacteria bacterium]|nr:hypothetical protein [Gammaproteobacteria bacterium]
MNPYANKIRALFDVIDGFKETLDQTLRNFTEDELLEFDEELARLQSSINKIIVEKRNNDG